MRRPYGPAVSLVAARVAIAGQALGVEFDHA
jgi:hypothetical protein